MGTARAEDGQGTPTQNDVSPSKLVHVHEESSAVPRGRGAEWRRSAREQGGKAGSSIRKHDHYTPARQTRRDVRATKARDHPGGRFQQDGGRSRIHILINQGAVSHGSTEYQTEIFKNLLWLPRQSVGGGKFNQSADIRALRL